MLSKVGKRPKGRTSGHREVVQSLSQLERNDFNRLTVSSSWIKNYFLGTNRTNEWGYFPFINMQYAVILKTK